MTLDIYHHDFDARDLYNYLINPFVFLAYTDTSLFLFICHCCCSVGRLNGIVFEHYRHACQEGDAAAQYGLPAEDEHGIHFPDFEYTAV